MSKQITEKDWLDLLGKVDLLMERLADQQEVITKLSIEIDKLRGKKSPDVETLIPVEVVKKTRQIRVKKSVLNREIEEDSSGEIEDKTHQKEIKDKLEKELNKSVTNGLTPSLNTQLQGQLQPANLNADIANVLVKNMQAKQDTELLNGQQMPTNRVYKIGETLPSGDTVIEI